MITPYDERHLSFCNNQIMFETYDEVTKTKLYDFYKAYKIKCYLPEYIEETNGNRLVYIIDIDGEYWEVIYDNKNVSFISLNGLQEL